MKIWILIAWFAFNVFSLNIELSVKECAGVGNSGYPVTTVIPLPKGAYQDLSRFRLTDAAGTTVPAQIEILNRRWAGDRSIANVTVTYLPVLSAFSGSGTGLTKYYFKDDGAVSSYGVSALVSELSDNITVTTGPLKFIIKKNGFNILDQVWFDKNSDNTYSTDELVVNSNVHNGGQLIGRLIGDTTFKQLGPSQYDADRTDVTYEVEKRGPVEVVIRAEAVTKYYGPSDHTHGWAVRIYAYAGKPYIKVDYQLQNSAKTKRYGWPLYFHAMNLNFNLNLGNNVTVKTGLGNGSVFSNARGNGLLLAQSKDSLFTIYSLSPQGDTASVLSSGGRPDGFLDLDNGSVGVTAVTRNFWRMWPNGLKVDGANNLSVQLFPEWSANVNAATKNGVLNSSHLFWLQDMQHVYKEVLFSFHATGVSDNELINLAKTVDFHPVASLPIAYVKSAAASLDLEGFIHETTRNSTQDLRKPAELSSADLGWNYYKLHGQRFATSTTGGTPFEGGQFWATENPSDWFVSEREVIGELNLRPEWMTQYNHNRDFATLQLGTNGVGSEVVPPRFDPHSLRAEVMGADMFDSAFLKPTQGPDGTQPTWSYTSCLDNSHMWRYHVADGYWISANPWLKDFYKFQAEYRKNLIEPGRIASMGLTRDYAHPWAEAVQAYKVTGDTALLRMMAIDVRDLLRKGQEQYGNHDGGAWHLGFFMRPLIGILEEYRESDPQVWVEVFQVVAGAFDWNLNYGNFCYGSSAPIVGTSYGGSFTLIDPQAWYYWYTGRVEVLKHLNQYIDWGIGENGDAPMFPDRNTKAWTGDYSGRWVRLVRTTTKPDTLPPLPITDLKLKRTGNQCTLNWTAPLESKKYHVVWDNKPIVSKSTEDMHYRNWWGARAKGPSFAATPGAKEQFTFTVPDTGYPLLYAAVFTWDTAWNMSAMSNTACQDTTPATAPANLQGISLDANRINLTWGASSDPESGIWRYFVYRNGVKIAEVDSLKFSDNNLQAETDYSYDVSALNGSNVEGIKAHLSIKTISDVIRPSVSLIHSVYLEPKILIYFSEQMDKNSLQTLANYSISDGKTITGASVLPDSMGVILACDALEFGKTYQLTLNGLKDLAKVPNPISPNTVVSFTHREPLKLDSLSCFVLNGLPPYFAWDTCRVGKTPYVDWSWPISRLPQKYVNLPMLQTRCADQTITTTSPTFITFNTNKALRVYVMLDIRQAKPTWLTSGFTRTGDTLIMTQARSGLDYPVAIYASNTHYAAGSKVTLPGLGGNIAYANYFIAVEPMDSSWVVNPGTPIAPPATPSVVWEFLTTTEGWTQYDGPQGSPTVTNGVMSVMAAKPIIYSPDSLNLDASKYSFVKIVLRNRSTDTLPKLFFSTGYGFGWNGSNGFSFKVVPSDTMLRTYVIDIRPAKIGDKWSGTLRWIRFEFADPTRAWIDIDRVELMPDTTLPPTAVEDPVIVEYPDAMNAYPNPFNPRVTIAIQCKLGGLGSRMPVASIYNLQGKLVARLNPSVIRPAGRTARFEYGWDASRFGSGAYLVHLNVGNKSWNRMVMLLK